MGYKDGLGLPCDALSLLVDVASGIREWDLPCDALSLLVGVTNGIQGWVGLTLQCSQFLSRCRQ